MADNPSQNPDKQSKTTTERVEKQTTDEVSGRDLHRGRKIEGSVDKGDDIGTSPEVKR